MLGLHLCAGSSLVLETGLLPVGVCRLLIAVIPLGSMGTGARGLQLLLGVGSKLAVARI